LSFAFAFAQDKAEHVADDIGLMLGCPRVFEMADMHINSAPLHS
jgi:hypothetical protein